VGSLTGVVASKKVTEASKGTLRPIGNRPKSVMAQARAHIDGVVWHLDVGSSHPGAGEGPKG